MFTVSASLGNTDVFVALHIKNISPNYPRDVIQMFDKPNMTITLRAGGKMRSGPEPEYSRWFYTTRPRLQTTAGDQTSFSGP